MFLDTLKPEFDQIDAAGKRPLSVEERNARQRLTHATTDLELAGEFIRQNNANENSKENIKKELFRFLAWCKDNSLTLHTIVVDDLIRFREFLLDPQPAEKWISEKNRKLPRQHPDWRPFSGKLSGRSARQSLVVVKSLFNHAQNIGYIKLNPGNLMKNIKLTQATQISRYLALEHIALVFEAIDRLATPSNAASRRKARNRFLITIYWRTGARLSEIAKARMGSIFKDDYGKWWIEVNGKGNKERRMPLFDDVLDAFADYRAAYSLPAFAARCDQTPLILSTKGSGINRITDEAVADAVKALFREAADLAAQRGDLDAEDRLKQASTHWLRHSMLTWHANHGVKLTTLQAQAGHAKITTTSIYLHQHDHERHDELNQIRPDQ